MRKAFLHYFHFYFNCQQLVASSSLFLSLSFSLSLSCLLWSLKLLVKLNWSTRIESNRLFLSFFSGSAQLARFVLWLFIAFSAALGQTKVLPRRGVRGGDRGGRQENSQLALWFICLASKLCYLVSTIYGQRKIPNLDSWQSMKRKCSNASIFPSLSIPLPLFVQLFPQVASGSADSLKVAKFFSSCFGHYFAMRLQQDTFVSYRLPLAVFAE